MDNLFLPGTASLIDLVDKRIMVYLRDGRFIFGMLRSYDQFANLVIEEACERLYFGKKYTNELHGLYIIRGENVKLLGQVNEVKEMEGHSELDLVPESELKPLHRQERQKSLASKQTQAKILLEYAGFVPDYGEVSII